MKPKLFVDGRAFDKYFEGTRTYIENLYKIIDEIGDFEIFIASQSDAVHSIFENSKNIKSVNYQKTQSKVKRALTEIPALISKYKIDASHFQYVTPIIKNSIQVVTIHDLLFKDFPDEFSRRYKLIRNITFYQSAIRSEIITTVSEYSKQAIIKHFKLNPDKVHIIPNGVAEDYFEPYNKDEAIARIYSKFGVKNFILYVSRIEPRKNQLELLMAYLDLKLYLKGITIAFVGKKDIAVPELDQLILSLPEDINRNIFFFNNVNNYDLKDFYRAAKLFVYPSKAEGFGIPPLEAAATGVPVICSKQTAMGDFDFFGENLIYPDAEGIKNTLLNIDNFNEKQIQIIKKQVHERYNWEIAAIKLNALILNKIKSR